jgi:hypothetical protein
VAFVNVYEDPAQAEAYSKLGFSNTYYLAYRDLPEIGPENPRILSVGYMAGRRSSVGGQSCDYPRAVW